MLSKKRDELACYRQHLWDYFSFHGNQRTTLIRYYIIFATLYLTGYLLLTRGFYCSGTSYEVFAIIISISFIYTTHMFQCLDKRNKNLMDNAKNALIEYEKIELSNQTEKFKLFSLENNCNPTETHTSCYKKLFHCAYLISSVLILWAILSLCCERDNDCGVQRINIINLENVSQEDKSVSQKECLICDIL